MGRSRDTESPFAACEERFRPLALQPALVAFSQAPPPPRCAPAGPETFPANARPLIPAALQRTYSVGSEGSEAGGWSESEFDEAGVGRQLLSVWRGGSPSAAGVAAAAGVADDVVMSELEDDAQLLAGLRQRRGSIYGFFGPQSPAGGSPGSPVGVIPGS